MIWVLLILFCCYVILLIGFTIGFYKVKSFEPKKKLATTTFSVVIPFRNEAANLPQLISSILALDYPKELVEFLFVNDTSTDASVSVIEDLFNPKKNLTPYNTLPFFKILDNNRTSNAPKKDAITTAISEAKYDWIITTDADCVLPKKWLRLFDGFIEEKQPSMVVAPVNYKVTDTFLEQFQLLDFMSLQATTIGAFGLKYPFLCNGANLGYKKDVFLKQNGFEGNNNIASGDDIFLFEKFLAHDKKSVHFLKSKEAIVHTFPVKGYGALIQQRIRWAAKTSNVKSTRAKTIGVLVFLVNLYVAFGYFINNQIFLFVLVFTIKLFIDILLFMPVISFYKHKKSFLQWYLFCGILYPFFSVYIVIHTLFFKYEWKGRQFKK